MEYKPFIFYCSPAGTTRHVAEVIEKKLAEGGRQATVCTLGREEEKLSGIMRKIEAAPERVCLFIGSPAVRWISPWSYSTMNQVVPVRWPMIFWMAIMGMSRQSEELAVCRFP